MTARALVVTGSRAEFGLLEPVMRAIDAHPDLELLTAVAGAHLLPPAHTWREVERAFPIAAKIPMQRHGETGRLADAAALGAGVSGLADALARLKPHWAVVLGDRIEAMAAACAASIGGVALAHIHGGDRAEGVADEAMRHAITKLAHLHLPATAASAERITRMGEHPDRVRAIGSPAIDGLDRIPPLDESRWRGLGEPEIVFLMHPIGRHDDEERRAAHHALRAITGRKTLALMPNHDPGRGGIVRAIEESGVRAAAHLARPEFIGLLRRAGALVGNSSAALIECAAIGVPAVNIGRRQSGRERAGNVVDAANETTEAVADALRRALTLRAPFEHPYGDGSAGERAAAALASLNPRDPDLLRKLCTY